MNVLHSNLQEYITNLGLVDSLLPSPTVNLYGGSAEQFSGVCSAEGRTQSSVLLAQPGRCLLLLVLGMWQHPADLPRMMPHRNFQDIRSLGLWLIQSNIDMKSGFETKFCEWNSPILTACIIDNQTKYQTSV